MAKRTPAIVSNKHQKRARSSSNSVAPVVEVKVVVVTSETTKKEPPPPPTIYSLPDEVLTMFFDLLELHDQCSDRRVCKRWNYLIKKSLRLKRSLKLNLIWDRRNDNYHEFAPQKSIQSIQFESNWTESKLEPFQKAQITVQKRHFNKEFAAALGRLFPRVDTLVIYFDIDEKLHVMDNFLFMLKDFKVLESFSVIRPFGLYSPHFMPKLFHILVEQGALKRLDLYIKNVFVPKNGRVLTKQKMTLDKILDLVEHFSLSCWPFEMNKNDQYTILRNVGQLHKIARKMITNRPQELISLTLPMRTKYLKEKNLDIVKVFRTNPELRNVKRLQFTHVRDKMDSVGRVLALCPKVQALQLFNCDEVDSNRFINMIRKCDHLTEVMLFGNCLTPYLGLCAPNIRKLTIGADGWFDSFRDLLDERDEVGDFDPQDGGHLLVRRKWKRLVAHEFVKLIWQKFPGIEELTVLTHENGGQDRKWDSVKRKIMRKLKAKSEVLKVINIEMYDLAMRELNY